MVKFRTFTLIYLMLYRANFEFITTAICRFHAIRLLFILYCTMHHPFSFYTSMSFTRMHVHIWFFYQMHVDFGCFG